MPRLFVAVWLAPEVVAELQLTALPRTEKRGIRLVPPENWHITLRFLGDADPDEVVHALDSATFAPARAQFGPAVEVLAGRALVVPVAGLDGLAATVMARTARIGAPPRRGFTGHVTLARLKGNARMPRPFRSTITAAFDVAEIALVQSRLGPQGARYDTQNGWPVPPVS